MKMYLAGPVTDLSDSNIDHNNLIVSLTLESDCLPCLRVLKKKEKEFVTERVKWILL